MAYHFIDFFNDGRIARERAGSHMFLRMYLFSCVSTECWFVICQIGKPQTSEEKIIRCRGSMKGGEEALMSDYPIGIDMTGVSTWFGSFWCQLRLGSLSDFFRE
ncbi:uncharacterized protein LOC135161615 [Diachasmimorpha longicaudata]|uniref:uncharacterized protein LOC135161615 n=1 Tax=Diachasmimorpha longicaudata TaxID=58733 RepID=UPI0030B8AA38